MTDHTKKKHEPIRIGTKSILHGHSIIELCIKYTLQLWSMPLCAFVAVLLCLRQPMHTIPVKAWTLFVLMVEDVWFYAQKAFLYIGILKSYHTQSRVIKDLSFGHHDQTLDVYPQHDMHEMLSIIEQLKRKEYAHKLTHPVVLFVYGGAWGSGDKSTYTLTARTLQERGFIVVIPNYRTYPRGTAPDMLEDVTASISWTFEHIHLYNGDRSRIHVVGHSAGAHLVSLAIVNAALSESSKIRSLNSSMHDDHHWRPCDIASVIPMSIVSDIGDHYEHETKRGIEWISPMKPAMRGLENFAQHSPLPQLAHLHKRRPSSDHDVKTNSEQLPPFRIIHGEDDKTVPATSSGKLHQQLRELGCDSEYYLLPYVGHSELILATMESHYPHYTDVTGLLTDVLTLGRPTTDRLC